MKAKQTLPDGYAEIFSVDLQRDKKISLLVNMLALLIAVVIIVPVHMYVIPIHSLFDMSAGMTAYIVRFIVLIIGMILYMILHELVHGITMKLFGTKKVKYGFTGLYAYAGSKDYYDKTSYIIIALAPVLVWGIILAVINLFVPYEWFWVVYMIQMINISGAAGDMYVTVKFSRMPKDILVQDYGVGMTVYSAVAKGE